MFEEEAEKYADGIYHYKINVSDYGEKGRINYRYSDVKEAYQKGAESREKRIEELQAQIEEMKCCYNCSKWNDGECEESPKSKTFFCADFKCESWECIK